MKTLTKQLFQFLLVIIIISFATNCKQDDLINEPEEVQEIIEEINSLVAENRKVNIDEISGLRQHINLLARITQNRTSGSNLVVTPFGNIPLEDITEVMDSLGNANYTFAIIPSIHRTNKFFNLVVHQEQDDFISSVVEYDLDEAFAQDYYNGIDDLGNFTGSIRLYTAEEFLALTGNEGARACGEDTGMPATDPCVDEDMEDGNNGTAGSDGGYEDESGEGDSDNGDPVGDEGPGDTDGGSGGGGSDSSVRPCSMVLMIINCGANSNNADSWHTNSSCGSTDRSGATFNMQIDCSNPFRTAMRDGIGCPVFGGPAAVSPVPFADLGMALGLTPNEDACLNSGSNCDLKNEIFNYLNANMISTPTGLEYTEETTAFGKLVAQQLGVSCAWDFEVDFEKEIIFDETFNDYECQKELIKQVTEVTEPLSELLQEIFVNTDRAQLSFHTETLSSIFLGGFTYYNGTDDNGLLFNITLNLDRLTNSTNLDIISTTVHEYTHAILLYFFYASPDFDINLNSPPSYHNLVQMFSLHRESIGTTGESQHTYMLNLVEEMAQVCLNWCQQNDVSVTPEQMKRICWGGLQDAESFDVLFPEGTMERQVILAAAQSEILPNSAGENPIGTLPCN